MIKQQCEHHLDKKKKKKNKTTQHIKHGVKKKKKTGAKNHGKTITLALHMDLRGQTWKGTSGHS